MAISQIILVIALLYAGLLFFVAWWTEQRARVPVWLQAVLYSFSLAVYCSSWTFFGAVGRAVENSWSFLPIYLGPVLLFLFGWPFLRRLLVISARNKITSIADFVGSRYGKRQVLAAVVTLVAVVGTLPYIALQLKAVSLAWATLRSPEMGGVIAADAGTSLIAALVMALFAILFSTRVLEGPRRDRGLIAAVALESGVKLLAFAVVAVFALQLLLRAPAAAVLPAPQGDTPFTLNFATQTLLALIAIVCLPRQFHVMVVEHHTRNDLRCARWLFPLYLALFSLLIWPVALAGRRLLEGGGAPADMLVLLLPLAHHQHGVAGIAFIGGLSAATGMVVVATITLSIMVSNELLLPLWLRLRSQQGLTAADLGSRLRLVRRLAIVLILLLGWVLERLLVHAHGLASIGLISFAAAAQLMPALVAGLYWQRGHRNGVMAGLLAGGAMWFYCLMLPALLGEQHPLIAHGPWGIGWLSPVNLLGSGWLDTLSHGVLWSLLVNSAVFVLVSRASRFNALDLRQANAFTQLRRRYRYRRQDFEPTEVACLRLQALLVPLVGERRGRELWRDFEQRAGHRLLPHDAAPRFVVREVEAGLASIIGAASAHRAVAMLRDDRPLQLDDFVSLMGGTSQQVRFGRELLQTTFETVPHGISVVDANLNLVAWNKHYETLFNFPPRLLYIGCPVARVYHYNAERGYLGEVDDVDAAVEKRLNLLREGNPYRIVRHLPTGVVVDVCGIPMGNGGYVTTYLDITEQQRVLAALEQSQRELEQRVAERTAELSAANQSLTRENALRDRIERELNAAYASKSRFLAAASHDLLQPISAARLFVAALQQKVAEGGPIEVGGDVDAIDDALASAEHLIGSLREIARLDSGKLLPKREHFPVARLLQALAGECSALAGQYGLEFRCAPCSQWVFSDYHLLRRVLQNFLANALRYTRRGKVLLGCRRRAGQLLIEVWDTGPGIAAEDRQRIFEEFERLKHSAGRDDHGGLGLGLAIASRAAALLGHELSVQSEPGRGSVFRIAVPLGEPRRQPEPAPPPALEGPGVSLLCIDNEQRILAGMQALLEGWGHRVVCAPSLGEALQRWHSEQPPDVVLVDYHLDEGETGLDVLEALGYHWRLPLNGIVISADNSEELRNEVLAAGYLYLSKPVQPAALRRSMRVLLRRRAVTPDLQAR